MADSPINIVMNADIQEIPELNAALDTFAAQHNINPDIIFKVQLVLDELINNVIEHGIPKEPVRTIAIKIAHQPDSIVIDFSDDAAIFNPLNQKAPMTNTSLEQRSVGGLGVHLVRQLMDKVTYSSDNNRNHLQLKIRLDTIS